MTIAQSIADTNASARKAFGADICFVFARAPAFGNDDTCILVFGKRHSEAAAWFCVAEPRAKVTKRTDTDDGESYEYSEINF